MVLERVTGQSLADLLRARLVEPLGLGRMSIAPPDIASPELRGYGTNATDGSFVDVTDDLSWFGNGGNGGIIATADDLLTVMRAVVGGHLPARRADFGDADPATGAHTDWGSAATSLSCGIFFGHQGAVNGTSSIAIACRVGQSGAVIAFGLRDDSDPDLVGLVETFSVAPGSPGATDHGRDPLRSRQVGRLNGIGPARRGHCRVSPGGERPDARIALRRALADLGEQRDGPLEMVHRLVAAPGVVEQVGEVVLDGGLEVPVADPPARLDGAVAAARATASSTAPSAASASASAGRRRDRRGRVRVVGRERQAPLEARRGRAGTSPRAWATSPTSRSATPGQVRVAGRGGQRAASAPRPSRRVSRSPARSATQAPLDQRARAQVRRRQVGRREARLEVAGRGRQVAPPAMDAAERDLDRRQVVGLGERGGRLERRDRRRILAEPRPQLADPRVPRRSVRIDPAPAPPRDARWPRGWRRPPRPVAAASR